MINMQASVLFDLHIEQVKMFTFTIFRNPISKKDLQGNMLVWFKGIVFLVIYHRDVRSLPDSMQENLPRW